MLGVREAITARGSRVQGSQHNLQQTAGTNIYARYATKIPVFSTVVIGCPGVFLDYNLVCWESQGGKLAELCESNSGFRVSEIAGKAICLPQQSPSLVPRAKP